MRRVVARVMAVAAGMTALVLVPASPTAARADGSALVHREWSRFDVTTAVGVMRDRVEPGQSTRSSTRHAEFFEADYTDVCDDVAGSIDVRWTAFLEDNAGDRLVGAGSCRPWSPPDLGVEGSIVWFISVPGGRPDGPDYVAAIFRDDSAQLVIAVLKTPTDDPGTWSLTHSDVAEQSPDGYDVVASLPSQALGSNSRFAFGLSSIDASGREDLLPEIHEPLLLYPESCQVTVFDRATVSVEPGEFDRAVRDVRALGFEVGSRAPAIGVFEVRGVTTPVRLNALSALSSVAAARRPALLEQFEVTPNDPGYPDQWALGAVGAPTAWQTRTGSQLTLAVVDDGIDGTRPDFAGRVLAGRDIVFDVALSPGANSDRGGHGTAVAGVAAAAGNNGTELAGIDWSARILPIRVTDGAGCITDASVAAAITYAADRGASVINVSMGTTAPNPVLADAVRYAFTRGTLIVASAGNDIAANQPVYPAAYPEVVSVGATTSTGDVATYSNQNGTIDVVAPGGDGSASVPGDVLVLSERDELAPAAGTSFSSPHVAGAALLYRAVWPGATPGAVAQVLRRSATDLGPSGRDDGYGYGQLDIAALLQIDPATTVVIPRAIGDACPAGRVPSSGFTDIGVNSHRPAIDCAVWWRVASGITASTYRPASDVTRAQMATFIARVIEQSGGTLPAATKDHFRDDTGNIHEASINRLAEARLVSGVGAGRYAPSSPVSRAQMATFLVRAFEYRAKQVLTTSADSFVDDDGSPHEPNINKAAGAGFTGGTAPAVYGPSEDVRRDQIASFLARVLDLLVEDGHAYPPPS